MGFILKIEGPEQVDLGVEDILTVSFDMETPDDANARSTDLGSTLTITGKIIPRLGGLKDETIKLAKWSKIPAEEEDAYQKLELDVINAGQTVRNFTFTHAFVVDYTEDFGSGEGIGTFTLRVRQKKDKTSEVGIAGGF